MIPNRFNSRALSIKDLLLPPESATQQQLNVVSPGSTEEAIVTRSTDPEEVNTSPSANVADAKRIPCQWDFSGSTAAARKRKYQAQASQRHRDQIKQKQSLMANVAAYSGEVDKLSYLVSQQRAQLHMLNNFKELVWAKDTDRALAFLGRHPQVLPIYVLELQHRLIPSIAAPVRFSYLASMPWSNPCMDFEVQFYDGTAGQVRWQVKVPLRLQAAPDFQIQEEEEKAEFAKSLLPTVEWVFFESLNIAKENSMQLVPDRMNTSLVILENAVF
ncbi:uncharacterized protein N7511_011248 [Penicillium nucicola]|uniref:uncharacterized protein n=1 Tax=Penicillium nucicola TaxID=1850975 RepID=UPI0025452BA7|nr:uncharacterized protein N7511_011248 [Penicillium nucicola]KAJ5742677.1 hypothetical protein N7511_011248 [Penicillium nucicola]